MKSKWFVVAYEGTFNGVTITAQNIYDMVDDFKSQSRSVTVTYDFYSWSPALSTVLDIKSETINGKVTLLAEITNAPELREFKCRPVHYLTIAMLLVDENANAILAGVSITQNPAIPGLDLLTFEEVPSK